MKKLSALFIVLFTISTFSQKEILVQNLNEYKNAIKNIQPGNKIVLKNGTWKDVKLEAYGRGTKENPIIIKAETAGEVILTGNSTLKIYGEYIIIEGLWFKDGNPASKSIVSFRKNTQLYARNCRFSHNTISYYNPVDKSVNSHWVDLWGKNNRVDHNNFTGKTNDGTTVVVWLKGEEHIENNHRIDHNFFGKRPELGKNGGETIRIGTSANSMKSSKTIVENNIFKNCDGEIEIISNKSADNIYRGNLFLASKGTLTLRHGNHALVENNVFIGNNIKKTGGIRVINEGHIIRNNLLMGIKGDGFRGPIVIMNGVPNSPLNRYHQVKNVNIQNNTIINSSSIEFGAGKDNERTLPALNTVFANNLVSNLDKTTVVNVTDKIDGITFKNNYADTKGLVNSELFTKSKIEWNVLRSIPIPKATNSALTSDYKDDYTPVSDISETTKAINSVGAFNLDNTRLPKALLVKRGPYWNPKIIAPKVKEFEKIITVEPGEQTIANALKKATSKTTLKLKEGVYYINKTKKINGNITIIGEENTIIKTKNKLPKALNYFFRIQENSKLYLENLILDGENDTKVKYAVVSPDKNNGQSYNLFVDNCTFKNFTNSNGGSIFKAYEGTFADTLSFKNSKFVDSYRGLNLSYEKLGFGKYNAQHILVHNSVFKNIEEFAINFKKTGPQMNDGRGNLKITNSIFSKVNNKEKGYIIRVSSIPNVIIKNSVFEGSYDIKTPIKLSGTNNKIINSVVHSSGFIKTSNGAVKEHVLYKNPKWENKELFIPSKKSILLKSNNKIDDIGLIKN